MANNSADVGDLNPLQRAFSLFILTLPSQDLDDLLNFLRQSDDAQIFLNENKLMKHTSEVLDALSAPVSPKSLSGSSRSVRSKKVTDRKLRPLNSFIAYRSFYSTIFTEMTQKAKSGIIRCLWQADPYKGKWAILAKAYSILRDHHGSEVALDTFLELTVPFIGLIQPEKYLDTMGCHIVLTDDQSYRIENTFSSRPQLSDMATNQSVDDIVSYCYERGYVENTQHPQSPGTTSQVMFAAQPNAEIQSNHMLVDLDKNNRVIELDYDLFSPEAEEGHGANSLLDVQQPTMTQDDLITGIDEAVGDLGQQNGGDTDFYAPFNPNFQAFPIYNPMAQDPFNAYDIDDIRGVLATGI